MKESRFRFWDKTKKHFRNDCFIGYDGSIYTEEMNDGGTFTSHPYLFKHDNDICSQEFTGFKDKLGRFIFEGDILHIITGPFVDFKTTVVYKEVAQMFTAESPNGNNALWWADFSDIQKFEVIGNIFENERI